MVPGDSLLKEEMNAQQIWGRTILPQSVIRDVNKIYKTLKTGKVERSMSSANLHRLPQQPSGGDTIQRVENARFRRLECFGRLSGLGELWKPNALQILGASRARELSLSRD